MPANLKDTIVKIIVFSFIVGVLLSFFEINPKELLANFGDTIQDIFGVVARIVEWGVKYILLGAVVVVPIWFVIHLLGKMKKK